MIEPFATLVASVTASAMVYPLDVIKSYRVRMIHTGENAFARDIFRRVMRTDGVRGFYRGVGVHMTTYPTFWSVYFATEEYLSARYDSRGWSGAGVFGVPVAASICAAFIANPLFVLKARLQTNLLTRGGEGFAGTVASLWRDGGIPAFFRGFPATAAGSLKLAIQMPMCDVLREAGAPTIIAAAAANIGTAMLIYPLEYIRTNQRISGKRLTALQIIADCWGQTIKVSGWSVPAGPLGMYRGIGSYLAVSCPNFVIMMGLRSLLRD